MKNIELAELLYPNVKDISFWENKYPKRKLPVGAEVTRFAPSPTGYLHIGNFFGCLLDFLIAKSTKGIFYFRLEDTDKKREIDGAGFVALDIMRQFGIVPDEGLTASGMEIGDYGPYIQFDRKEIYQSFAKYLISIGRAFPCFCEKNNGIEDVENRREFQLQQNNDIEERDICRNLSLDEVKAKLSEGKDFAVRLLSTGKKGTDVVLRDVVRGERTVPSNQKDIILIKSNGIPVYAFAHAVDDHLMGTTLVVRGEEYFATFPSHIELFQALNFESVKYLHNPLICKIGDNGNKRKISKRKDVEADMRYFLSEGYPTQSVIEYLTNLANSNFEQWRKAHPFDNIASFNFDAKKIGVNSPMFDIDKLNDISKTIISRMNSEDLVSNLSIWADEYDIDFVDYIRGNRDFVVDLFRIDRENSKPRKDIYKWSDVKSYFDYMFDLNDEWKNRISFESVNLNTDNSTVLIEEILSRYSEIYDPNKEKDSWFADIKHLAEEFHFATDMKEYKNNTNNYVGSVADISSIIRIALTGKTNTPDMYYLMKLLGTSEVKSRLITKGQKQ